MKRFLVVTFASWAFVEGLNTCEGDCPDHDQQEDDFGLLQATIGKHKFFPTPAPRPTATPIDSPRRLQTTPLAPPTPSPPVGTIVLTLANMDWEDGVVFCRGPELEDIFVDANMTQQVNGSQYDCSSAGSVAAQEWGEGVPDLTTLAMGVNRGETVSLYMAPKSTWVSGTCWFQGATSNKERSLAKGPMYQSQFEFTIDHRVVSFDVTSVEGVSGGLTMNYTDILGNTATERAIPGQFEGDTLKVVPAPQGLGFPTVLSNKWTASPCNCETWGVDSAECNTDGCYAACPSSLVDNPCGQHRCRLFYAKQYSDPTSYCGWLYKEESATYCWAMDEWLCVNETCGYGGTDEPAANCSSQYPADATANSYSCGRDTSVLSGIEGKLWWTQGPGCVDKLVNGVPTNDMPRRKGGVVMMTFEDLPWLHTKSSAPTTTAPDSAASTTKAPPNVFCNPNTKIAQLCPGGIPCPQCGGDACLCP